MKNYIFYEDSVIVHYNSTCNVYRSEIITGGYPLFTNTNGEYEEEDGSSGDTLLFFPISDREFKRSHIIKKGIFGKDKPVDTYYGFLFEYKIITEPTLKMLGKTSSRDLYKTTILYCAQRFVYFVKNGEIYITELKDSLYPPMSHEIQGVLDNMPEKIYDYIDDVLAKHCELYVKHGNI